MYPYVQLQKQSGTITGALAGTASDHNVITPVLIAAILFTIGLSGLVWMYKQCSAKKQKKKNELIAASIQDMANDDQAVLQHESFVSIASEDH